MEKIQNFFIGKYLAKTNDPFEQAKLILSFRFSLIYLLLTLPTTPFCFIFHRMDIFVLACILFLFNISSFLSITLVGNYRLGSLLLAMSCLCSGFGYSILSSASTSVILFIWPIIGVVFLNFTLGSTGAFWNACAFALSITVVSILKISGIIPVDPVDDIRLSYSTGVIIIIACIILYQLLVQFNITRDAAIQARIASDEDRENIIHLVAHDLRNSFSAIIASTGMLKTAISEGETEECDEFINLLSQASGDAVSMINNLMDAVSIDKAGFILDKKDVDLCVLIKSIIRQYYPVAQTKKIEISFVQKGSNCIASADPERMKRIISNLISNAIKFTSTGGQVVVTVCPVDYHLRVMVNDTGIGIPQSLQAELFKKYSPAARRGTNGERSTGLGMYIVKTLLDLHGAKIIVSSKENEGTEISFDLPQSRPMGDAILELST